MINILPTDIKQQLNYAKRNARLVRYLMLGVMLAVLLGALFLSSFWYADRQIGRLRATLDSQRQQRETYQATEDKVKAFQGNLGLIEKLLAEKTVYSQLLKDLAAVLPAGSYINHLTLTGDDTKPLELLVTVSSFNRAAELRNSLIKSPRFVSADIQSISQNEENNLYSVSIVAAFDKGQSR
ncbi:PilN domain-containing protein [Candidatus Microgenomates bacterium]|nr:PilN domain-containing protein [Candidatus Microgenomates bacterium]